MIQITFDFAHQGIPRETVDVLIWLVRRAFIFLIKIERESEQKTIWLVGEPFIFSGGEIYAVLKIPHQVLVLPLRFQGVP